MLLSIRFNDFIRIMDNPRRSTLQDDLHVLLGKPAKGFFNRETLEIEQLLKATGRETVSLSLKESPFSCLRWGLPPHCFLTTHS